MSYTERDPAMQAAEKAAEARAQGSGFHFSATFIKRPAATFLLSARHHPRRRGRLQAAARRQSARG